MNRRIFLLGTGGLLAGSWAALNAQPTPGDTEVPVPRPEVNPAQRPRVNDVNDKALIDDTDVGKPRVDEDIASPSDVQPTPPQSESPPPEAGAPQSAPSLAPATPSVRPAPYLQPGIAPGGCMPCQPVACPPPPPCQPVCYPRRRRHHHRRRRGC